MKASSPKITPASPRRASTHQFLAIRSSISCSSHYGSWIGIADQPMSLQLRIGLPVSRVPEEIEPLPRANRLAQAVNDLSVYPSVEQVIQGVPADVVVVVFEKLFF